MSDKRALRALDVKADQCDCQFNVCESRTRQEMPVIIRDSTGLGDVRGEKIRPM